MHTRRLLPLFVLVLLAAAPQLTAQCVSLTALGSTYTQNFDSLVSSGQSGGTPTGWSFVESLTNANALYTAGTGSSNTGETYSFGSTFATDRAFGALRSGNLATIIGSCYQNNTGTTITSVAVGYTGEQWRLGTSGRGADRIDFQYSTTAISLSLGTYTDVNALDFSSPITTGTVGALNGNLAANRTALSAAISGLAVPNGGIFFIRWTDADVSGADDGLSVDDFSITPGATTTLSINDVSVAEGNSGTMSANFTVSLSAPAPSGGVTFDIATADNTATVANNDYAAASLTAQTIPAGSSTYTFSVSVKGDTTVEPTETYFVNVSNVTGASVVKSQGIGTIVNDDVVVTPIHDVQGSGAASPYNGTSVSVRGIVTAVKQGSSGGYFVQAEGADVDADPNTSEGIFVFTGSSVPSGVAIGNRVVVTGTVSEFPAASAPYTTTELVSSSVSLLATGQPLPAPVTISAADGAPTANINQYERFEGMRVATTLTVVAPTDGNVNEPSATATSTGVFYGVVQGVARPFREPGIPSSDVVPSEAPCPSCIPRFDQNPELLRVDSDNQPGSTQLNVAAGQTVSNVVGALDFGFEQYTILPEAATVPVVSGPSAATPVDAPAATEVTVASYNLERFYDTTDDAGTSDVVLSSTAFANRLNKASLAIRNILRTPDVVAVVEMENINALTQLANKLNADAVAAGNPNPSYQPYLAEGNDIGGIDVGFLVKSTRVSAISVTQEGKTATYVTPEGATALLNDRPSLVLVAEASRPDASPFRFTVVANHLRSLNGAETNDAEGRRIRAKRRAQAEWLANFVQARQTADPSERLILVGDFNAFEFSDGLVDMIGTILGTPAPANQVVLASPAIVNPPLVNLSASEPADQRYSFTFDGNAQSLDHALARSMVLPWIAKTRHAHLGSDFPETFRNTATRPERIADHDALVVYLNVPAAQLQLAAPANATYGTPFTVTVTARDEAGNVETSYRGTVSFSSSLAATLPAPYTFTAADNGVHTFTILPRAAGSNTITASNAAGPSASATVLVAPAPLTIKADDKTAVYNAAIPPFTATYTGLVAGDTPASLGAPAFTCSATAGSPVGTYPIAVSGVASPNYIITFAGGTLTITAAPTSTSLNSPAGQYSDSTEIVATVAPAVSGSVAFTIDGASAGSVAVGLDGTAHLPVLLDRPLGTYPIAASFTPDSANYTGSSAAGTLTVAAENADVAYTGVLFASNTAPVTLRATVADAADGEPGDLDYATVQFVDLDTNTPISPVLPAGSGSVQYDWNADIGNNDSLTFHVGVIAGGRYIGSDDVLITVMQPSSEGVNGGGYITDGGLKTNFGINAHFNGNNSNLLGHVTLIVRSGGTTWQVKGNPISLAGIPSTGKVTLVAKVLVKDGNATIESNASLELTITDNGEPGEADTIGIKLWSKTGTLMYSAVEQVIGGGNLQVH
jgi:uncharacterized protein